MQLAFYDVLADFFREVECRCRELPNILCSAKQVLLNKNDRTEPLNKRLTAILAGLTVIYTGVRFAQLQQWQAAVIPPMIHGAIRGRSMTDIPIQIALDFDFAAHANYPLIGIKLDKSKAFGRVAVPIANMLLLALGAPHEIATFMARLYEKLGRHTSYGTWISPNGIFFPGWRPSRMFP